MTFLKEFEEQLIVDREHTAHMGGFQRVYKFSNDYGASLIQTPHSYGGENGLYEIAVLKFIGDNWKLTYDTEITNDVLGYLEEAECIDTLNRIKAL